MPATYLGKKSVVIPSIAPARLIPCILVRMQTWCGWAQKHRVEDLALPINHKGVAMGRVTACFDPETGERRGNIASTVDGFHDAIGKRLSWGKEP
ncbi:hypothetical protein LAV_00163 [Sphingobium phage Lacusarx]|uniref:Uncharacterized protein n=1 Tax=Sphingobium phage Lacusarx TaxID=1980139 RepID=A0A1W6DX93_9CAUD|nr:hypothetical protein FDH44_gp140 [Sphingobium phage Lacusarx]ARK07538.1 hypothetical protein LAV_00163 [Sphingobium phage Lacusarx]